MAVIAIERSSNRKTGTVSATYAPSATCPASCPFRGAGCYGEHGPAALHLARINKQADGMNPVEIAQAEAEAIASLSGQRPLRMHVVGDCPTDACAMVLSEACSVYARRSDAPVWTYTHAWRDVSAQSWGRISVLASCETVSDVITASERGYACSVTGPGLVVPGYQLVRCPAEYRDMQCVDCLLCCRAERLRASKRVVVFTPHGAGKNRLTTRLQQLRG